MDSKCCIIIQINSINNNNTSVHSIEGLQCIIIKVKIIASNKTQNKDNKNISIKVYKEKIKK